MSELFDIIKAEIESRGPVTVARYMELALGHEEHGYYKKQDPFGQDGDFTTAPEISQMFGEMVGLWAAVVWQAIGKPEPLNLVELGPGRGTLMADMLRAAYAMEDFDDAVRLWLIETSPVLKDMQKRTLAPVMIMPAWREAFEAVGTGPLIAVGNEFFDALPIRQYELTGDGWRERLVGLNDGGDELEFVVSDERADDGVVPASVKADAEPGAIFEDQPASRRVMRRIAERVVDEGGAALFIDYGHVEHGAGETLQAVKDHEFADVLKDPGDADLTAHVDFEQLAEAAREGGAEVLGPIPQGAFLDALGMRQRADSLMMSATPEQMEEIDGAHKRLTDPEQMGVLFKVVAVVPPGFGVPPWSA